MFLQACQELGVEGSGHGEMVAVLQVQWTAAIQSLVHVCDMCIIKFTCTSITYSVIC